MVYVPHQGQPVADALSRFLKEGHARNDWLRAITEWADANPQYTTSREPVELLPLLRSTDGGPCLLIKELDRARFMPIIK